MVGWMHRLLDGCMDGLMEGRTYEWLDGQWIGG
jgi:hypothetical protein